MMWISLLLEMYSSFDFFRPVLGEPSLLTYLISNILKQIKKKNYNAVNF